MPKNKIYTVLLIIFILAFLAANLSYPKYFNRGVDFINSKTGLSLPFFWELPFRLGLDLQGGTHLLYEADLSQVEKKERRQSMEGLRDVIERRVDIFGVREPVVQIQETGDDYRLIVELAGVIDPAQAIEMIGQTPFLEFREPRTEAETEEILEKRKEIEGLEIGELEEIPEWQIALEDPYFKPATLTGKYLKKAEVGFDHPAPTPLILIEFDSEGAKLFEEITARNVGQPLAIYIDEILISAPIVQGPISGGNAQITGDFTIDSARELARNLNAGALPVPINVISQQSVGPILGKISLRQSLRAGIIGFLAVVLFMIFFYRFSGFLASLALFFYLVFILSLFKLIPVTLTLAGIAGLILSLGMAVDANILIFSRIKEEFLERKNFAASISEGFSRAWPSIRDSNITTLITSLILFSFGTSFVKGFALILGLGILVSMFSAIIVTRYLLRVFEGTKLEKKEWLWG